MERSEIRGSIDASRQSRITLRSIRATFAAPTGMTVLQKRGCSPPRCGLDSSQSGKNKRRRTPEGFICRQ
jgi:hypothetical protein